MNSSFSLLDFDRLLDVSPYLTKGSDVGVGVMLKVGDSYIYGLIGGGLLLILAALALVRIMYRRTEFFALEYGNGGFFGRAKIVAPSIFLGGLLFLAGAASAWVGWQKLGYSVTLSSQGLVEVTRSGSFRYAWSDASGAAERIKATNFWVSFAKEGHKCRVNFQQRYIGEKLQDKAIAIAENALAYAKVPRSP